MLQFMGSQRVGHDCTTELNRTHTHTHTHTHSNIEEKFSGSEREREFLLPSAKHSSQRNNLHQLLMFLLPEGEKRSLILISICSGLYHGRKKSQSKESLSFYWGCWCSYLPFWGEITHYCGE